MTLLRSFRVRPLPKNRLVWLFSFHSSTAVSLAAQEVRSRVASRMLDPTFRLFLENAGPFSFLCLQVSSLSTVCNYFPHLTLAQHHLHDQRHPIFRLFIKNIFVYICILNLPCRRSKYGLTSLWALCPSSPSSLSLSTAWCGRYMAFS